MFSVAVFLVCLLSQSSTEPIGVRSRCINSSIGYDVPYTTFTPSVPEVQGRYTAELCTFNKPDRTHLTMTLTFKEDLNVCDPEYRKKNSRRALKPGSQHSSNTVEISGLANCSHVCYAMDFDLIFSSCYLLKSTLRSGHTSHSPHDSYFLINNNMTKENYNKTAPYISFSNHEDYFSLDWYLGVPAVDYSVTLRRMNNDTGAQRYWDESMDVTQNCTLQPDVRQLFCKLAPPYGCYQASFVHGGLWTSGLFHHKSYVTYDNLCHKPVVPPGVPPPRSRALWWACGAALLACSGAVGAGLLRRRLLLRDYHKRVLDFWFNNRQADVESPPSATRDSRAVLLLYAREGEHGQHAMAALKDLIQHSTGGTVYDIFSPEVMALCGPAPHSWVRGVLRSEHVRVLLVQSPATAALYQDQLCEDDAGLRLREPLLGRRAMYRAPHFGDQLLQAALRHVAESADLHQAYNKYYLATYQGLETDILPAVVSYRRYVLPSAARALAADLAGAQPDAARLQALQLAVHAALQHAQHNPDYLMDEVFIF